jgi:ADP-ribosylglycohydrolase
MNTTFTPDRFRGILMGAAIGDAMGMPFQYLHPQLIRDMHPLPPRTYLRAPEGQLNARLEKGQFTDETQLMTLVTEVILEKGDIDAQEVALGLMRLYDTHAWVSPGRSILAACRRLRKGMPWHEAGGYRDGSKPLAFVPPVVLRHPLHNEAIFHHSASLARMILIEPRVLIGCSCFGLLLKNILLCRDTQELPEAIQVTADYMEAHHPAFHDMLLWVLSLLDVEVAEGLEELGTGYSILETLFAGLFVFLKFPDDFAAAVSHVVYAGDNSDTTGFLAGAFAGAFNGYEGIPENLVAGLRDAQFFLDLADRLYLLSSSSPS